jgi:hypothetical protein
MTLVENIAKKTAGLPRESQQRILRFVESLRAHRKSRVPSAGKPTALHPGLKAVYGIWADRSDLAEDSLEVVRIMRARSAERRRNG